MEFLERSLLKQAGRQTEIYVGKGWIKDFSKGRIQEGVII